MVSYALYCIFRRIIDFFVVKVIQLCHGNNPKKVSQPKNKLLLDSAVTLASKIRNGQVTSQQVVKAFIDRINEVNPLLNAMVDDRFEQALQDAKEVDRKIENKEYVDKDFERMPFLGVPFTTKDTTACKGLSWTYGLVARRGIKAEEDAPCVQAVKSAGGILLGVTNVPELNMWVETYNKLYGTTNNPYDIRRNVGGSSGGEGSIIAGLGSPIGIGSDIAGSIRIPGFRCGIFGHKPTSDLISTRGLTHRNGDEGPTMVVAGPMAKYAEDLLPMLKILINNAQILRLDDPVDIKTVRILYTTKIESRATSPLSEDLRNSVLRCVKHFQGVSELPPKEIILDDLKHGVELWKYMSLKEKGPDYHYQLSNYKHKVDFFSEILKFLTGRSDFTAYTMFVLLMRVKPKINFAWCQETLDKLREDLVKYLGDDGVLILPPEAGVADFHYRSILQPNSLPPLMFVFSALKFPVTQVPLGLNADGLPVGVQVVTAPNNDRLSLAVARELERAFGGYVQP